MSSLPPPPPSPRPAHASLDTQHARPTPFVRPGAAAPPSKGEDTTVSYKFGLSSALYLRLVDYAHTHHDGSIASAVRYLVSTGLETAGWGLQRSLAGESPSSAAAIPAVARSSS